MKENNTNLQQAFQFLSFSNIFNRKSKLNVKHDLISIKLPTDLQEYSPTMIPNDSAIIIHDDLISCCSSTTRSNSNSTISSILSDKDLSPLPTPSTSTDTLEQSKEDKIEPWKLLSGGRIQYDNYFYMDRQEIAVHAANSVERDAYGFKRPTQWVQTKHLHQFDVYYQPIFDRQKIDWDNMLQQAGGRFPSIDSNLLKKTVRKGIPSASRGKAWMHYSGAKSKMKGNPELYSSLVNTALAMGELNEHEEIIQRDLHRTFPDNAKFACAFTQSDGSILMEPETNSELSALRRILLAFSVHSPQIGYCQSLNYLAGFFLLFVDSEEEAFWMLVTAVHDYMPENMYDSTMEGSKLDQAVLMMLIKERFPSNLWKKINKGSPPITLVTSHWFLTMYINILPVETVLRIWDCFFVEGYSVMFQVALSIISMNSGKISQLQDPIEIFQILQNMPRRLIDCPTFMDHVFSPKNKVAAVTQEQIIEKRIDIKCSQQ